MVRVLKKKLLILCIFTVGFCLAACEKSTPNLICLDDHELTYRGLCIGKTTVEELLETLGEPFKIYQEKILEQPLFAHYYIYDPNFIDGVFAGFDYMFYESPPTLRRIYIKKYSDYPTPYNINIADLLETVLKKLSIGPTIEKNILEHVKSGEDYSGLFYGTSSEKKGYGSFSIREKGRKVDIRLVSPTGLELLILVKNRVVSQFQIGYCYD